MLYVGLSDKHIFKWSYLFEKSLFYPLLHRLKSGQFSETATAVDNPNVSD